MDLLDARVFERAHLQIAEQFWTAPDEYRRRLTSALAYSMAPSPHLPTDTQRRAAQRLVDDMTDDEARSELYEWERDNVRSHFAGSEGDG